MEPDPEGRVRDHALPEQPVLPDGRDPNSYANVAWIFGRHDRPWPERPIFGKVRSMTANGLERKFDMAAYLCAVDKLVAAERA